MLKGILFFISVWVILTCILQFYSYLDDYVKLTLKKSILYGLYTALLSSIFVGILIVLF